MTKKSQSKKKIKSEVIDLGETGQTRIVIDRVAKSKDAGVYVAKSKILSKKDSMPSLYIQDDPEQGLSNKFRFGNNHALQVTIDNKSYQKFKRLAQDDYRTPTAQARQLVLEGIAEEFRDPEEKLND